MVDYRARADSFEVNPEILTIGKPVGEGAFGKVLTGTFQGKKVAIKILRGKFIRYF